MTEHLISLLKERGLKISTAESCTGGLIASKITSIPGSSEVFQMGFVTYAEKSKMKFVGVKEETLAKHSVYSREVAVEMAVGCLYESDADVGIGVTGVAGTNPEIVMIDGHLTEIEPGTVYICCAKRIGDSGMVEVVSQKFVRNPSKRIYENYREEFRNTVRDNTADFAIEMAVDFILKEGDQ
jgi:nicotinamide-nucleotide amidase